LKLVLEKEIRLSSRPTPIIFKYLSWFSYSFLLAKSNKRGLKT
ncbi:9904_t:CDS:1, partial [Scutellospora calospora]